MYFVINVNRKQLFFNKVVYLYISDKAGAIRR